MSQTVIIMISIVWFIVGFVFPAVVCAKKGKPWFIVLGFFVSEIFVLVGAIRLAKPGSRWYEQRYDREKKLRANDRFYKPAITDWRVDDRGRFYIVKPNIAQFGAFAAPEQLSP